MTTVAELIAFLQTQPQNLPVAYEKHSEHALLELPEIHIRSLCRARTDGWVHSRRPDQPTEDYLVFPGN